MCYITVNLFCKWMNSVQKCLIIHVTSNIYMVDRIKWLFIVFKCTSLSCHLVNSIILFFSSNLDRFLHFKRDPWRKWMASSHIQIYASIFGMLFLIFIDGIYSYSDFASTVWYRHVPACGLCNQLRGCLANFLSK